MFLSLGTEIISFSYELAFFHAWLNCWYLISPCNKFKTFKLSLLLFDKTRPISMKLIGIDSPHQQRLPSHTYFPEGRYSWTHSASKSIWTNPILVPKILEEVSMSFWVPVYFPSVGNVLTREGRIPVLKLILG